MDNIVQLLPEMVKATGQTFTMVSICISMAILIGTPVGILLCTQKNRALVEYALAGMDNHLFVSKYQLELPKKEDIQRFLEERIREVDDG